MTDETKKTDLARDPAKAMEEAARDWQVEQPRERVEKLEAENAKLRDTLMSTYIALGHALCGPHDEDEEVSP